MDRKFRAVRAARLNAYVAATRACADAIPAPKFVADCPCCGYPTLADRGADEICPLCDWQDDGQDDPHADEVWWGPNYQYSLAAARRNFRRYLTHFHPEGRVTCSSGNSNTPEEERAKRAMMAAFDALLRSPSQEKLLDLLKRIEAARAALVEETARHSREYEAQLRSQAS